VNGYLGRKPVLRRKGDADRLFWVGQTVRGRAATGGALRPNTLSKMVGEYIQAAAVGTHGACQLFRHAMATAMLENGADVRIVQAMLGHANLQTTAIYTHVAVAKLKKIHDATHPAGSKHPQARNSENPEEDVGIRPAITPCGAR
jgi:integrase/recombinase XerD